MKEVKNKNVNSMNKEWNQNGEKQQINDPNQIL